MAGLGWQELSIVLIIIMIIFGAGKLPDVAKSLGQGVKEFKQEAGAREGESAVPASVEERDEAKVVDSQPYRPGEI